MIEIIFVTPYEYDAKFNRQRIDNSYGFSKLFLQYSNVSIDNIRYN